MSMGSTMGMGSIMAKKSNMRVSAVQLPREYRQKRFLTVLKKNNKCKRFMMCIIWCMENARF